MNRVGAQVLLSQGVDRPWLAIVPPLAGVVLLAGACAGGDTGSGTDRGPDRLVDREDVRSVPAEYDTIQAAVDAASSGDLVLVAPGVYREEVTVETPDIVIRGLDRNEVILDGEFELENGIYVRDADGVAIENMTARNYEANGFLWTGVERYRGSYLTAYNNGSYGIYAFDSTVGLLEQSYASGHPDAGFYIGQCYPCQAVIDGVVAERNRSGYSGTNAGGDLFIVNSTFRSNHNGIVPNTSRYEENPPQRETTVAGNLVHANNLDAFLTSTGDGALPFVYGGNGILVSGGIDNVIERNRVFDHDATGIGVVLSVEPTYENGQAYGELEWWPAGNVVRGNAVDGSGLADLAVFDRADDGNCFEDNEHTSSAPESIEELMPCGQGRSSGQSPAGVLERSSLTPVPVEVDHDAARDQPPPEPRETMHDADIAPWHAATAPPEIDLAGIEIPAEP